jgi:hypothetical protein
MIKGKLYREYSEEEQERERLNAAAKDFRYIYWHKEAEKVRLDHEEYNKVSRWLKENGVPLNSPYKTRRIEWCRGLVYRVDNETRKHQPAIYVSQRKENNQGYSYTIYYTEMDAEKLEREGGAGHRGWNTLDDLLREKYGFGLDKMFGTIPVDSDGSVWCDRCVKSHKQMIWFDRIIANRRLRGVSKADIKSAFPAELRGPLPDANTAKQVAGRVAPTAEYPFAFYVNSGHVAEYGKYDTHELRKNAWYRKSELSQKENAAIRRDPFITYDDSVADEDEITVLMRPSRYTIDREIERMFWIKENAEEKKTRGWYKWMLNALIGFMRSEINNKQHYQGHIAAIVYCRVINKMLGYVKQLLSEQKLPIYFAIDCMIWYGGESNITTNEAKLGNFMKEATEADCAICGQGQYYLEKDGQVIVEKHQGVADKKYADYNIQNMDDFVREMGKPILYKEVYDKDLNEFIYKEVMK